MEDYQALYRKYRPRTFDDVCGEEHITSILKYESANSRLSHAYLLCGPRGTGKTSCAKILAKAVNCLSPIDGNPCGKCEACKAIDSGNSSDVVEMDAASNNGVDAIREIREIVRYAPSILKKRVYIVDEVHMLSQSAFNALLKTLEEPPEYVVFILATTEFNKIPETIVSRCQRFDFRRINSKVIADRLQYIAEKENIKLDSDAAMTIARQSKGGMRDAIGMLQHCSSGGLPITKALVRDALGMTNLESLYTTAVAVSQNDIKRIFEIIKGIIDSSKDLTVYWDQLIEFWRDMLVFKYLSNENRKDYLYMTDEEIKYLENASKRFSPERLSYHFTILDDAQKQMTLSPATKNITAEISLIRMADTSLDTSVSSLLSRIADLEHRLNLLTSGGFKQPAEPEELEIKKETGNNTHQNESVTRTSAVPSTREIPPETPSDKENEQIEKKTQEESPAPHSEETAASSDRSPVFSKVDVSEIVEILFQKSPTDASYIESSECLLSDDKKKFIIRTESSFAQMMLETNNAEPFRSYLISSGIITPDTVVEIETGLKKKDPSPFDELESL